ncbi:YoaK family protein [Streptomyces sp. NPDC059373]
MPNLLRAVWTVLVPGRDQRHGPLPPVLLVLTVVTGLVDAFSYLSLGHVFVANMTGNIVFIAFATAGAAGFSVIASLLALGAFLVGALAGGRVTHRFRDHRGRMLRAALTLHTVLVAGGLVAAGVGRAPYRGSALYLLIALLGLAMGVQNALARSLAVPDLTTTVLTMTLTGLAAEAPESSGVRTARRLLATAALFVGALLGATAALRGWSALPLLLAVAMLAVTVGVAYALARSRGAWVDPA